GVVAPSQEIYDEVKRTVAEKKVVVSMGSVAASGGYYIASPATMIYANPGTITGSIGVIMKFSNIEGLLDKVGLKANTLKSGPFKDIGSATRPMTVADQAVLQGVIDSIQSQFIRAVASGRKLPEAKVRELADGRIFSGEQAVKLKLVDKLGGLQDAIDKAAGLADIKGEPRIIYPPKKKRHFMDLLVEEAMEDLVAAVSRQQGMSARYQLEGR
ncbi:MAG TPA: signal peptide peptidase SppA, partial [Geobacterales bacterium]|nr:signal peptide peptidase SppA [Geobacterales bacterium]